MKRNIYITIGFWCLAFAFSGCNEKDEMSGNDNGTKIEGIALSLDAEASIETGAKTNTRATLPGYSVNTADDPTHASVNSRTSWKLDFTLYNGSPSSDTSYSYADFKGGEYDGSTQYWKPNTSTAQRYFPNYKNPKVDLLLYPSTNPPSASVVTDQSVASTLLDQDILFTTKTPVQIAHNIIQTPAPDQKAIVLNHQRAMLDFVISDIVFADIASVTVQVGLDTYIPYLAKPTAISGSGIGNLEYLLILPEGTTSNPVVKIVTKPSSTTGASAINYIQNIGLLASGALGSNNCYCFTLQGNLLSLSPITIVDWTTGEPVTGQYVAVTAYPTFKGVANETWYLYYDNKLTEPDGFGGTQPKLQAMTFNDEGECTVKPDGRVITHIFKVPGMIPTDINRLITPIPLDQMYITLP